MRVKEQKNKPDEKRFQLSWITGEMKMQCT